VAIIFWELLTAKQPFAEIAFDAAKESFIISGGRPEIPPDCHPEFMSLIQYVSFQELID
jgi:hypothetical protein